MNTELKEAQAALDAELQRIEERGQGIQQETKELRSTLANQKSEYIQWERDGAPAAQIKKKLKEISTLEDQIRGNELRLQVIQAPAGQIGGKLMELAAEVVDAGKVDIDDIRKQYTDAEAELYLTKSLFLTQVAQLGMLDNRAEKVARKVKAAGKFIPGGLVGFYGGIDKRDINKLRKTGIIYIQPKEVEKCYYDK